MRLFLDRGSAARGRDRRRGGAGGGGRRGSAASWTGCRWRSSWPPRAPGTLSAEEIEAHLADRFRFLAYRRPVADPRHQALRAAIGLEL